MKNRAQLQGFTLVELLIALLVVGVLLSALVSFTGAISNYTRRSTVINASLSDLNDVAGYVGLNVRSAMAVVGEPEDDGTGTIVTTPVRIQSGADTFDCAIDSADGDCIGLVVPNVNRASTASTITGFDLVAYRIVPLSAWAGNPGLPGGWNGDATPLMLEYRATLCAGCTTPPAVPAPPTSVTTATPPSLVVANLFFEDAAGAAFEPFEVQLGTARVTLRLRARGSGLVDDLVLPGDGPLELAIIRRP